MANPEQYAHDYATTLADAGGINNSVTALTLASATGAPTAPFRIRIDNELMLVGARSGTACSSITRALEGTTAASHSLGAAIDHVMTAAGLLGMRSYDVRMFGAKGDGTTNDAAAINSAITACRTNGGGFVDLPPGNFILGTTSIVFDGDSVIVRGSGKNATFLTYTGTGAAVKNAATTNPEKRYCGMTDLAIDVSGATSGSTLVGLHIFNFYRGIWQRLQIKCGTVATCDGIRLEGTNSPALTSTYYNIFEDIDISTSGTCVHMTGVGPINRNQFHRGLWEGAGKALIHDTTGVTCDTNVFADITITCTSATNVMNLGGNGAAFIYNHFINLMFETGTSASISMATASGVASNNYFLGGIYGNNTIATQDNMDNHVWIPSQEGLDYMKIGGNGVAAQSLWFERDNGGMTFGSSKDTNLYRGGSSLLKTDDDFQALGNIVSPILKAGSATAGSWPKFSSAGGTLLTTPEVGAFELDTSAFYFTTDAGNRGVVPVEHWIRADATRTFTSNTSAQNIFTSPTNGTITLEVGTYEFEGVLYFTAMSVTSGNLAVSFAGTGTFGAWLWMGIGQDSAAGTVLATGGNTAITNASSASISVATTATALGIILKGTFECTGAGTWIPQITMVTASATVLAIGSYIKLRRVGSTSMVSVGQWT